MVRRENSEVVNFLSVGFSDFGLYKFFLIFSEEKARLNMGYSGNFLMVRGENLEIVHFPSVGFSDFA
ncbi:hypothetical protein CYANOKiyG1_21430 [Okeania sp. KiyG1]|nr:hypothetical protein CYANOKiyG1_21430 [Okeania sp. KiyG1]